MYREIVELHLIILAALPVLTIGLRYLTTRQCVIIASILCSGAFIGGSFASSIDIIVITNGLMAGETLRLN